MIPRAPAILAICSVLFSGCGTLSDCLCGPVDDHVFYRGVRFDLAAANEGGWKTIWIADIPFSAVADTGLIAMGLPGTVAFSSYAILTGMSLEPSQPNTAPTGNIDSAEQPAPFPAVNPPSQE